MKEVFQSGKGLEVIANESLAAADVSESSDSDSYVSSSDNSGRSNIENEEEGHEEVVVEVDDD
eukprot:12916111-Prorocentrum_lima.AAC.1